MIDRVLNLSSEVRGPGSYHDELQSGMQLILLYQAKKNCKISINVILK